MSDVLEPELEMNQDLVGQESVDPSVADGVEASEETNGEKQGLVNSFLTMGIYNVMLLLSLIFICWATLNMLGVLRTYSESFPFGGGFPWSTNL